MGIRDCALQSSAFTALKYFYDHREAVVEKWRADGKKIVGQLGCDVPDELILAAGMLPVRVYADQGRPLKEADKYLEFSFDPVVRAQFEKLVDGSYGNLVDYLAISNSTDTIVRIFLYLREIRRQEPEKNVPPIDFIDWLFTRNRMHQERNELIIRMFRETLEKWSGHPITDDDIRSAGAICNENRAALRRIQALRRCAEPRITGSEALVIIGASLFMEKEKHIELCLQVAESAKNWPVAKGPRIYYTGSNQENTDLYDIIEEAGGVVVGEDQDWGDRHYDRDYKMEIDPVRAVVDRYMLRQYSAKKSFVSQRVEALDAEADAVRADGVVFFIHAYEEAASWDYPSQKQSLELRGIATAAYVKQIFPIAKNDGLAESVKEFIQQLKGGE